MLISANSLTDGNDEPGRGQRKAKVSLRNKNILITGISGFVGSYMAKHLLDEGANVFGLDKICADSTTLQNVKHSGSASEINVLEGDIQDISAIASALRPEQARYCFPSSC